MANDVKHLQDVAYEKLKEMFLTNKYHVNEMYSETKVAANLGISRTPVRAALLRLNQEGFIDIFPSRGFMVKNMDLQSLTEVAQIRSSIEGFCAYTLADNIDGEAELKVLVALNKSITMQEKVIEENPKDIESFTTLDYDFHQIIVDYPGNQQFKQLYDTYQWKMREIRKHFFQYPYRMNTALAEHKRILEYLTDGNSLKVYELICSHADISTYVAMRDSFQDSAPESLSSSPAKE